MGLLAAIGLKKKVQFIKNGNTVIEFEASLQENHSRTSTPTEFPIENGNIINDHVILKPFELTMTAIITDNPINSLTGLVTEAATTLTSALTPPIGVVALGAGLGALSSIKALLTNSASPSVAAYNQLRKIQEDGNPFTVLTSLARYESMVINSMSVPRESQNGDCIIVTIGLTQLKIVSSKKVKIQALANPGLSDSMNNLSQQSTGNDPFRQGYNQVYSDTGAQKAIAPQGTVGAP
jgi:hypothetical protein